MSDPRIIEHEGKPTHVILTVEEYQRLAAAAEDLADLQAYDQAAAAKEESFPDAVAQRLMGGNHPARLFRDHRGLTLSDLSHRTSLSTSYLSKIESGGDGSVRALQAIAQVLDVTVDDLID